MKKLLILALVALVAGAAFAETSAAFTGEFDFVTTWNFADETYSISGKNDATVNLNGVVSDYASVNAELGVVEADIEDGQDLIMKLNQFNLTHDITGALGVDGPVGVSLKWGYVTHEAAEYQAVAGYEDKEVSSETGSHAGSVITISIVEKVNIIALIAPGTYFSDWTRVNTPANVDPAMSFEVQFVGLVDGLNANIWWTADEQAPTAEIGFTAGYVMGPISSGLVLYYYYGSDDTDLDNYFAGGVSFQYTFADVFTAGLAFGTGDFSEFVDTSSLGINFTYHAVAEMLDLYAAVKFPFTDIGDKFGVDVGLQFMLTGVTYTVGYDYGGAEFKSSGEGMYLGVNASF